MSKADTEVLFSIDIESDGPIPIRNSMLSFGCVAFAETGEVLGEFERNLNPLPQAVQDPSTMGFWAANQEAWNYCTSNTVDPCAAMTDFVKWVKSIPGQSVAVCMPSGFDFTFMYMYMMWFVGESPFSFSSSDTKTYVSAMRKQTYRRSGKSSWPARWSDPCLPHTHKAIDDALEQGLSFVKMRAENLSERDQESVTLALSAVGANFWNSRGGKPGTMFSFKDGVGKVRIGTDIVPFPKRLWTSSDSTPQVGDQVVVTLAYNGDILTVQKAVNE